MIPATRPVQRPADARLLVADASGRLSHRPRRELVALLRRHDLVVANDAATLPASLMGTHLPSGRGIEVRLAGARSLHVGAHARFTAIVFGGGDFRTRTEERAPPPSLAPGDRLALGPATAVVERGVLPAWGSAPLPGPLPEGRGRISRGPSRLVDLRFHGTAEAIWEALVTHGRPIQYAHVAEPLALWDVWTPFAAAPLAFEPPSAGFALDWRSLGALRARGAGFATLTLAAGISSTGDSALDAWLPFDEPYRIPEATAAAITRARAAGGRVIAVGTTVARALESAAAAGVVLPGEGTARLRLGRGSRLQVVDALLSGTHEPGTSHHALLGAFTDARTLARLDAELESRGYRTHEFGDSVFVERRATAHAAQRLAPGERLPGVL